MLGWRHLTMSCFAPYLVFSRDIWSLPLASGLQKFVIYTLSTTQTRLYSTLLCLTFPPAAPWYCLGVFMKNSPYFDFSGRYSSIVVKTWTKDVVSYRKIIV